jgi:hypothetical protein
MEWGNLQNISVQRSAIGMYSPVKGRPAFSKGGHLFSALPDLLII